MTCQYFKIEKVRFTEGVEEPVPYDQPVVWMMLEGEAEVRVEGVQGADPVHARRNSAAAGGDEQAGDQDAERLRVAGGDVPDGSGVALAHTEATCRGASASRFST